VVETAGEKAAQQAARDQARPQPEAAAETSVDMAALAPSGLPKEVTPEEVAAITAAAAQIQMAGALQEERRSPEFQVVEPPIAETPTAGTEITNAESQSNHAAASDTVESSFPTSNVPAESGIEVPVRESTANTTDDFSGDRSPQSQDEPVTMAATAESVIEASPAASRWTAVPVALEGDEATLSLDQEMQKAYAATAPEPVAEPEPALHAETMAAEAAPIAPSEAPTSSLESALPVPVAEIAPTAETSPTPEVADPTRAEFMSPVSEAEVAGLAGLVGLGAEVQEPAPPVETVVDAEPAPDSETVKTTAAAWASWRETHDASKGNGDAQANESETPESVPAESARAVAAGAEQALQEASSAPANGNPADVASIVESVLADLRPKLMAEISRKMAEKK
jgi:hypothetical protein